MQRGKRNRGHLFEEQIEGGQIYRVCPGRAHTNPILPVEITCCEKGRTWKKAERTLNLSEYLF